jgi:RNA polymerase sigma factor (sigma-70 family)
MENYRILSDGELIQRYVAGCDNRAAEVLINRHSQFVFGRLRAKLPYHDAQDYEQNIWQRLFNTSLKNYSDDGRFKHFLSKVVSTEIKHYWKKSAPNDVVVSLQEFDVEDSLWVKLKEANPEDLQVNRDTLRFLATEVIPNLPPLKRLVWLLRNEAEFATVDSTITWETLAQLNGLSVEITWQKFEAARAQLLLRYRDPTAADIDTESLLIYLVWTHSQRPVHQGRYTLKEISVWVGVPESTLKERYYSAEKIVAGALADFGKQGDSQ